jgi:hypothetical protein
MLRIEFLKLLPGRKLDKRCVKPKRSLRKAPRCTRKLKQGVLTRNARSGRVEIAFDGRMDNGKRLAPGKYEAVFIARDEAGNESKPAMLKFRVLRR